MFFICVHTCSSKEKKEKRERRNFTIPLDSKSHYKFTGINTSIFLADISWILNPNPSFLPPPLLHPSSHFPFSPFHPSPFPMHISMLNNISLFTHFLSFVSSASPLYFFFHPTLLSFFLFFLFFFYLISIHPIEYIISSISFIPIIFIFIPDPFVFLSLRFLFQHGPLSHVDIFIGHILHFIQRFPLFPTLEKRPRAP